MTTITDSFVREAPRSARIDWSRYLVGAGIGVLSLQLRYR